MQELSVGFIHLWGAFCVQHCCVLWVQKYGMHPAVEMRVASPLLFSLGARAILSRFARYLSFLGPAGTKNSSIFLSAGQNFEQISGEHFGLLHKIKIYLIYLAVWY